MRNEPIYSSRLYFVRSRQGISGFRKDSFDYGIASGATVKGRFLRSDVGWDQHFGNLNEGKPFRLDDGHFPDHQPLATYDEACHFAHNGGIAWLTDDRLARAK